MQLELHFLSHGDALQGSQQVNVGVWTTSTRITCCEFASKWQDTSTAHSVDIQSRLRTVGLELIVPNDTAKKFVTLLDGDVYIKNGNIS